MMNELPDNKDLEQKFRVMMSNIVKLQVEARLDELTTKSRIQSLSKDEKQEMIDLTRAIYANQQKPDI